MVEDVIYAADGSNLIYKRILYKVRGLPKFQYRVKVTRLGEKRPFAYIRWTPVKKEMNKRLLERTQEKLHKKRISIEPIKPKEIKKALYRSGLILSLENYRRGETDINYHVWIYHEKPDVTSTELRMKINELKEKYAIPRQLEDKLSDKIEGPNEEIEEDEIDRGQELNIWYGYLIIKHKGNDYPQRGGRKYELGTRW